MKIKLFTRNEFPPTTLFNSAKRIQVPVSPEPHEGGWLVETEDLEAASTNLKDFGFLLVEPAELQLPQVPNFAGDSAAPKFKFKAANAEELKNGRYFETFAEKAKSDRIADEEVRDTPTGELNEAEEAAQLREKLEARGMTVHHLTGIRKLRSLFAGLPAEE